MTQRPEVVGGGVTRGRTFSKAVGGLTPGLTALAFACAAGTWSGGCGSGKEESGVTPSPTPSGTASIASSTGTSAGPAPTGPGVPLERVGGVVARTAKPGMIVVVDEDHLALRLVDVKVDPPNAVEIALPGRPAQVVALADALLVTIRDPGLLLRLVPEGTSFKIAGTAKLPDDAWGVSISPDEQLALVTSAWSRRISGVDLSRLAKGGEVEPVWSLPMAREPRGIVFANDDVAYVTHLVGAELTRLGGVRALEPVVTRVALPASPLRAPSGKKIPASLGYSAALGPEGDRLFVARHALGALGRESWFGASTVDVLLLRGLEDNAGPGGDVPLAPPHVGNAMVYRSETAKEVESPDTKANIPADPVSPFLQPRDVRTRKSAGTILVVGEGDAKLVELDATAVDPTLAIVASYDLAKDRDPILGTPNTCGAPSGVTLSEDERTAYVFCRSTYHLAVVPLAKVAPTGTIDAAAPAPPTFTRLATDPIEEIAAGRRLFYDAVDPLTSGGLACAGCHPEGRDDGFTWHEATFDTADGGTRANFVGTPEQVPDIAKTKGVPRQTPMLAGRVNASGPYGWMGESKTLADRIGASFGLHRWGGPPKHAPENVTARAGHLIGFVRKGLVPPVLPAGPATEAQLRGKALFESPATACASCHRPETEHTDRVSYPLRALPTRAGYDPDPKDTELKTPSLRFVGGTDPYLHDGSAATLEDLIDRNGDRMGKTNQLSPEQRADLIAYLRTL